MKYISTRGYSKSFTASEVILQGIAPDGGLFVPEYVPMMGERQWQTFMSLDYPQRAAKILSYFLSDYTPEELLEYTTQAYSEDKFDTKAIAPLVSMNPYKNKDYLLELWHGPTSAFKDMALQILPSLLTAASQKNNKNHKICILTATSGDTGTAALEGFKDIPNVEIIVFYPTNGVSEIQKMQMTKQAGDNCHVFGVEGNFDDAQTGVKQLFANTKLQEELKDKGYVFSSANSINWGRLAPQIAYYVSAYLDLMEQEALDKEERFNVVVPTGNFGNILAAWYARRMGVPIHRMICASNKNKVLSDFFRDGVYNKNRELYTTSSPSMDILVSSNLERLLFELNDRNSDLIKTWMQELNEKGQYKVSTPVLKKIQQFFVGGYAEELGIQNSIQNVYDTTDHCVDTHTAVGFDVYSRYQSRSQDPSKTIFVSTASPFKFPEVISEAIFGKEKTQGKTIDALMEELSQEVGLDIPEGILSLKEKPVLHDTIIRIEDMEETVKNILK